MSSIEPEIKSDLCICCGECAQVCRFNLLSIENSKFVIFTDPGFQCDYCGDCESVCLKGAIRCPMDIIII